MTDTENERARELAIELEQAQRRALLDALRMSFGGRWIPREYIEDFHPDLLKLYDQENGNIKKTSDEE